MSVRLSELLSRAGVGAGIDPGIDPEICGVTLDSRAVETGDLFFAIRGFTSDGEAFAPDAIRRGARAILAASERPAWCDPAVAWITVDQPRVAAGLLSREFHGRPDESMLLIGITGTNGKTTTAHLVESMARAGGHRAGRIGTVGFAYAGHESTANRTTPEAPEFYRVLAEMRNEQVDLLAAEISSHALALSRVEGARFAAGVFLNLSRDHLDFHRDREAYFEAKAKLFDSLESDRLAVVPAENSHGKALATRTRARVLTFGTETSADVRLEQIRCGLDGSCATLVTPWGKLSIRSALVGDFNLLNIAAAATCLLGLGLAPDAIAEGVAALDSVRGRAERIERGQPFTVLVDYAHTDGALSKLLGSLRAIAPASVAVVFGCGGDRDKGKRFTMGRVAAEGADRVYLTSDNPRGEDPGRILEEIGAGVAAVDGGTGLCRTIPDRHDAVRAALTDAAAGDIVVLAGKGHETTMTVGERVLEFDDRIVASLVLEELGWQEKQHADA